MKACVLHAIGDLRYETVKDPVPGPGEVLLKIKASGVCGSDIDRVFHKGTYSFPTIPGHEFAGEVVEAGDADGKGLIGKKAAVFPLLPCRRCDMCETGHYASCRSYSYFGSRCDGGFAEYISVPVWNLVLAGDSLSCEEAAMAEPAAVSLHALSRAGINLGDSVAIFGAGPIGLMLAEFSKASGAGKVILVDIDEKKIEFAKHLGHAYAVDSAKEDAAEAVMELTEGKGADLAVEGTGAGAALQGCLRCVKPMGKAVLMGNPSGDMHIAQNAYWEILRKQLTLYGTWNSDYSRNKNDWQTVLALMAQKKPDVSKFITHKLPLSQCAEALLMMKDKKEFYNKVMFVNP